jgi:addiction module HigA family antidote
LTITEEINHANEESSPSWLAVRFDCLEPMGLSVVEGAKVLGVTRQAMNNLVSGRAGISAEMAIRLEK